MAVFSAIGNIIGSNKQAKAIDKASDAQAAATQQAINLQRDIYNQNVALQSPFYNTGVGAMNHMNALLGIQVPNAAPQAGVGGGGGQSVDQWAEGALNAMAPKISRADSWAHINAGTSAVDRLDRALSISGPSSNQYPLYQSYIQNNPRPQLQPVEQIPVSNSASTPMSASAAYDAFKGYTGYTSRLNEANNAMNSGYAARGTLQSGAAMQAMAKMNQDYASNEFGNYMGYLGGQQQLGYGAANALSGVGTNYANSAGGITLQGGDNMAAAAMARGNNAANMWSGLGSSFGNAAQKGAQMIFGMPSDRRLKKDVLEIAKRPDGLTVFEWTYRNDPDQRRYQGFMADEVKDIYPDAYIANYNGTGYSGVNYAAIPREAA